jgi:osmoprotectant transport system substrate-binding protein
LLKTPHSRAWILLVISLFFYGAARLILSQQPSSVILRIGSKNFTESLILGELYAQSLEIAGYHVERKFNLGGTLIAHESLKRGQIDLYPEYTGTSFINILHRSAPKNPEEAYAQLSREYQKRWQLSCLKPALANDSQGLVITRKTAQRYKLYTLSRLAQLAPQLALGSIPEFEEREDGLQGLQRYYRGFHFKKVALFDNGLKYQALQNNNVDVVVAFTTDGDLSNPQFVLLQDDKAFWPSYQVIPIIRTDILRKSPAIKTLLDQTSGRLTTSILQQLNSKVDLEKQDYRTVVHTFLTKAGEP